MYNSEVYFLTIYWHFFIRRRAEMLSPSGSYNFYGKNRLTDHFQLFNYFPFVCINNYIVNTC
jgi:hypothetical protein